MESKREYTTKSNSELAYLIGYLACDGAFVNHKNKYPFMSVCSTEKYIVEYFREEWCPDRVIYNCGIKSSSLVKAVNQVYELRFPREMNTVFSQKGIFCRKPERRLIGIKNEYLLEFMAACLDADGFITVTHRKDTRTPRLRFFITHGSERFLADLQERLEIPTTLRQHGQNVFRLQAQNTVKNMDFLAKVHPFLRNHKKVSILENYLNEYYEPQNSDELLEPTMATSSQAQDTSWEGSETTGEVESS